MSNDPIIDIIRSIDLTGAVFLNMVLSAPWAMTSKVTEEDCRPFLPIPRQVIAYHVVVQGEASIVVPQESGPEVHHRARAGDILFLPHNRLHVLASTRGLAPLCSDDLILPHSEDGLVQIRHGGEGEQTRILCGFMASNAGSTPLLDALPEILIIPVRSLETRNWIEASAVMAAKQLAMGHIQSVGTVPGLCQLLLAEALRLNLAEAKQHHGWLKAMAHPRMAKVLARIHCALDAPPSVAELAIEAGMSRSALVERFAQVLGVSPRQYILDERMKLAAALLRDGDLTSAQVAIRVGYDAPEAFSRAFKKHFGVPPRQWRDRERSLGA